MHKMQIHSTPLQHEVKILAQRNHRHTHTHTWGRDLASQPAKCAPVNNAANFSVFSLWR